MLKQQHKGIIAMVDEIKVGDRVRVFDYKNRVLKGDMACFTEGVVLDLIADGNVNEGRYVIKVDRDVWSGKETKARIGHKVFPPVNGRIIYPAKAFMNRVVLLSNTK